MNIKAIITDLDRTLLHTDKTVSRYTAEVLSRCKERGIALMVATARPLRAIEEYRRIIDFDAVVVSNGARIICGGRRIDRGMKSESAVHLLRVLEEHPEILVTLETGDIAYSNRPIEDYETVISAKLSRIAEAEGAVKILMQTDYEEIVKGALTDDLYYTVAGGYLIQIMGRKATKWNGIKEALSALGISADEALYFGDDHDDIEPIRMCGLGVAVSNAIDEVKAAADRITGSNDEDGVARFIEDVLLGDV